MKKLFYGLFISLILMATGCSFVASFIEEEEDNISLSFDKNKTSVSMGAMDVINLTASEKQNSANISWSYDDSIIFAKTDNYSAVITGLQPGTTTLTASCGSNSTSCIITVSSENYAVTITNPYVYTSSDFVSVSPNETVKISAALFGGTVADINGYTWSIDKTSVASLSTEGNYCWITGVNDGIAKITVKHNKAAYGYSVLVNCSSDGTNQCYITTKENILTINLSETNTASFAVDLMNSLVSDYSSGFTYSVVDSLGNEITSKPVVVSGAGSLEVSLTAYEVGDCYIRCSHPSAVYDLDVLVRVIENAETAYIEPSSSLVTVSDDSYQNISLNLLNYAGTVKSSEFSWSFSENASEYIDFVLYNGDSDNTGDNIDIKGIKTGSVKLTVSYPGVPSRNIIVLVRNIESEASDATCYITTSQNYIRMTKGDSPQQINITLKNADSSDVSKLKWTITNSADDGSTDKVINWKSGNGSSVSDSSRSVIAANNVSAYAVIEPLKAGTAYIDISHPKAMYSTRITVVVTEVNTVVENKSYLSLISSPVVYIKNGNTSSVKVSFSGSGNTSDIVWSTTDSVELAANGTECVITAPSSGTGGSQSTITVSHEYASYPVKFSVICYDDETDIEQYDVKTIYSYKTNEVLTTGQTTTLYLETEGFSETPSIFWTITEGSNLVTLSTENNNKNAVITANKVGDVVIKASVSGCDDVLFTLKIKAAGVLNEDADCYLSTTSNVLYFEGISKTLDLSVELFNISTTEYDKTEWSLSDSNYDISANGSKASITSLCSEGSATLTISHPLAENTLIIYLKTGNQYEYINEDSCYISTNQDVFELYAGQDEVSLVATLNHTEEDDSSSIAKGFTFEVEDSSVAEISYVNYSNTCYIKPVKNGTTKIFVRHVDADFEKEVVVIVNNAPNASSIPYLTTTENVITVIQGDYATATVTLMNSNTVDNNLWKWESLDSKICDVIANNGTSAMLCANAPGTVEIKVSHAECIYSLKLIVTVLDSSIVTSKPYIFTSSNIITLQKGFSTTLTAEMIGGTTASDSNYFRFVGSSSSLILVNGVSGSCYIKALNTGMAYVTVYNSRYSESYSKTVLVVIEDEQEEGVYISPSTSIVKIKPTDTSLTTVSATLVNGNETDGEDFIWWVDDYNLIGITAVAEQCSIIPTGKTGTTKLHIKHAKASKQVDILVMVSNYDAFAFSTTSATISAEKLYFYPLQVPTVESDYEVTYSSSNEEVCLIQGSNAVAWVCGRSYGTASLTASMKASDGTVLATTEMLVSVTEVDPVVPVISLGNTILTVEAGTSKVISATITGEGIESTEKYNLKWSVKNKASGISLLDETADKTSYGSECYVTFNEGGEYVLSCTHESSGATADLYFIVEEKGIIDFESLSSNLITMYKDDGSITLTATLNSNASDSDYKNISWSAVKVGGQNIVAVSKAKGANCTVTPKMMGQTQVIAKLPNGKTAICIVIVKANTEISVDVGSLHVIPGYTEIVNYKTNPENATINWYTQMTTGSSSLTGTVTNYFTIEDDTAKKQLRVTGLQNYTGGAAGTITASMVGASSANLPTIKVYVEYEPELRIEDLNGNMLTNLTNTCPDTDNVVKFNVVYYPADLIIDIKKGNTIFGSFAQDGISPHSETNIDEISCGDVTREIVVEEGFEKCKMTVSLIPHTECGLDITVTGTLPADTAGTYAETKTFFYSAYYDSYDIDFVNMTQSGAFTKPVYGTNGKLESLELGDGEEAVFYLKIKNENAAGTIQKITSSNWSVNSDYNRKDIHYGETNLKTLDRNEKAKQCFGVTDHEKNYSISKNNIKPKKGLIYLTTDDSAVTNTTVYHLGHGWDYYQDLPEKVQNFNNNSYSDTFIEDWAGDNGNNQIQYWLVSRELVYQDKYYAVPHNPAVPMINVSYEPGYDSDDWWEWCMEHHWEVCGKLSIKFNNNTVFYKKNNNESGTTIINYGDMYKPCIPYVMTTTELKANNILYRPSQYRSLGYTEKEGWVSPSDNWINGENTLYFNKLISPYITPTTKKCTENEGSIIGKGSLTIKYTDGHGNPKDITLSVNLTKRECEAYTNGFWTEEKTSAGIHYRMSEELFDKSELDKKTPYLTLSTNEKVYTTTEIAANKELLNVEYEVYPSSDSISITIPSYSEGKLSLASYSSKETDSNGNTIYKYSSHDSTSQGVAKGTLKFLCEKEYKGSICITSDSNSFDQYLSIKIQSENNFVPEITSKVASNNNSLSSVYSSVNQNEKLLIVGDGETVTGKIINLDTSSSSIIKNVTYEAFSTSSKPAKDTSTDQSSKTQSDLTSVSVTSNSGVWNFTVKHTKDYGYFASSKGTVDEFYGRKFNLNDVTVTEDEYEQVYIKNGDTLVLDTAATNANKLAARKEKLHKLKYNYAFSNKGVAKTSYSMPYYYNGLDVVESTKNYELTPVGHFLVTFDNGEIQEIFVCIKVTEGPCCTNGSYGYDVPSSYYLNVTK